MTNRNKGKLLLGSLSGMLLGGLFALGGWTLLGILALEVGFIWGVVKGLMLIHD